jgi:hypothetical protein
MAKGRLTYFFATQFLDGETEYLSVTISESDILLADFGLFASQWLVVSIETSFKH